MSILVIEPGLQTTIQAAPRTGLRHLGVPASGPADPLSMALANRLVGNSALTAALEVTLSGLRLRFEDDAIFAVSGASTRIELNELPAAMHCSAQARAGDELGIESPDAGARIYVAFAGGLQVKDVLGSASTYVPAGLGGYRGRALQAGDILQLKNTTLCDAGIETPVEFRPPMLTRWTLRACAGADIEMLDATARKRFFERSFVIGQRSNRMGLQLQGEPLHSGSGGRAPSEAVFPGTVQCPEDGRPFLLSIDAQTTGGYPRIAQVVRMDRHLIGQLRPGNRVRFLQRDPASAVSEYRDKLAYWREWLADAEAAI